MKTNLITKKNGEAPTHQAPLENMLTKLPNKKHTIRRSKKSAQRTLAQNALFWLWMKHIAHEIGSTRKDMHDYYCQKFLQRQIKVSNRIETVTSGTRNLSKDDFTIFLNKLKEDAIHEFGIVLPEPSENSMQNHPDQLVQS